MAKKTYKNYDDTLVGRYIRQIENPDSVGWDSINRIWVAPGKPGYDSRNRGMGVDVYNNEDAIAVSKNRQGRYLTEAEENSLRNGHIDYSYGAIRRHQDTIPALINMSPRKEAEVIGAIYRGDANRLWSSEHPLGKALRSPDENDFHNAISEFYRSKNLNSRADNNDLFWNQTTNNAPVESPYKPLDTNSLENQKEKEMKSFIINNMKDQVHDFTRKANLQREINGTGGRWSEGGSLNSPWDGLSLQEKAEMMKVAVRNGIYNLNEIKQKYNEFAEGGKLSEDKGFNKWRESLPDNLRLTDKRLYDLEGAYRAGMQPTLEDDGYYHLGSRDPQTGRILKTPMHPTYWQAIAEDARLGYYPTIRNGETYTINEFKKGGGIHIKPENRGKFTALKKRTGHSASWFKEHGTPAQRKMATFALNARHWKHALGGNLYGTGGTWKQQHEQRWHDFLLGKGLAEADASRLAGFFTAQDGLESAGGKSSAARQKNNYGGMQKNGKNITYDSVNDYMEDKWRMMNSRFKPALSAQSIDEYATILGNPETAGKGYLYYVTDKAKYDPKSPTWKAAQTQHMHNYINGMRAWAGKSSVKFNDPVVPKPQVVEEVPYSTYVAPAPTAMPQFIPYNPEVFFGNVQPATPEPIFTIAEPVQETPVIDYEKQDRMDGIRRLGMIMGLLNNTQSTNPFDILTANYFDGTSQPTQQMNSWLTGYENYNPQATKTTSTYAPNAKYSLTASSHALPEVVITGKKKPFIERVGDALNPSVMVQAAPGTATAYSTSGAYMPRVKSNVGTELATAATAMASPWLVAPGSSFWMNPLTQQMMAGTTMSEGVNLGTKVLTGRDSFGQLVGDAIEDVSGWNPNNEWWGSIATESLNPGWYLNPNSVMNAVGRVGSAVERGVEEIPWRPWVPRNENSYYRITSREAIEDAIDRGSMLSSERAYEVNPLFRQFVDKNPGTKLYDYQMFSKGKPWEGSTARQTKGKPYIVRSTEEPNGVVWQQSNVDGFSHHGHDGIYRPVYFDDTGQIPTQGFEYWKPNFFGYTRKQFPTGKDPYYNYMGSGYTVDRGSWMESDLGVVGSRFGDYLGGGGEQTVFEDAVKPNSVLKVHNDTYASSVNDAKSVVDSYISARNSVPLQEPVSHIGVVGHDNLLYPVYSQAKLKPLGHISSAEFNRDYLPIIQKELLPFGYRGDGITSEFTDGLHTLVDLKPENIGLTPEGKIRFFDVDIIGR